MTDSTVLRALRDALATRVHAEMLFDQTVALLGDGGVVETVGGGGLRKLFLRPSTPAPSLRAGEGIVPWPVMTLNVRGHGRPVDEDAWMRPAPEGREPRGRGQGPGAVDVYDGAEIFGFAYGDDGRCFESIVGADGTVVAAARALTRGGANAVELLAGFVAGLEAGRHGPGRVVAAVPFPVGVEGLWGKGRGFLREALFHDRVPPGAAWAAADALVGEALGWGASAEEALEACRAEVRRLATWVPRAEPAAPFEIPEEALVARAPAPDAPMPDRSPGNVPLALVPLAPWPSAPPPFGAWRRVVGDRGAPSLAVLRAEEGGFTLFGDRAIAEIHGVRLEKRLAEVDAAADDPLGESAVELREWPDSLPPIACKVRWYRLLDEATGKRVEPRVAGEGRSPEFSASGLDGDRLRNGAMRLRWIAE